jgi:ligand-binding SRPBCC domain-containing protein
LTRNLVIDTWIRAPLERCFDAARDIDVHMVSMTNTNEKAIAGRTSGLIELGETVTWRARHFGITQALTSRITAFDRPHYFQDTMERGAFKSFRHDHVFTPDGNGTNMRDLLVFAAPLGVLGLLAEALVLQRYLERLLVGRAAVIKEAAERGHG